MTGVLNKIIRIVCLFPNGNPYPRVSVILHVCSAIDVNFGIEQVFWYSTSAKKLLNVSWITITLTAVAFSMFLLTRKESHGRINILRLRNAGTRTLPYSDIMTFHPPDIPSLNATIHDTSIRFTVRFQQLIDL